MAPARRMTRSNREVYPIMFLPCSLYFTYKQSLHFIYANFIFSLSYIDSVRFILIILITSMQDSDSQYSYETQGSEEQYIDQNDTDQGTLEFVNPQHLNKFPYNAIGAVAFRTYQQQPRLWNGTGFLVSPNLVLTVAHNIINEKQQNEYLDLRFYHMLHGQLKDPIKVIDRRFPQQYKNKGFDKKKSVKYDYALLKLQKNIIIDKYFRLSEKLTNDREPISIFGYQGFMLEGKVQVGRQIGFIGESQISIVKINTKQMEIRHTLPSKSGHSGSPIITEQNEVVSIHKGCIKNRNYNIGVLINKDMIQNLRKWQMEMNSKLTIQVTQYLKQKSLEHSRLLIRTASQRENLVPTKIIEESKYQKFPYCCIGQTVIQYLGDKLKNGVNTGFLISNNLVLTSFNSIFNPQIQNFSSSNASLKLYFIATSKTSSRQKIPIESFKFNLESLNLRKQKLQGKMKNEDMLEDIYFDYCLLKLSKNIETKYCEYLQLTANYLEKYQHFSLYGYPSRNQQGEIAQKAKLEGNIAKELDIYGDRHMIAHNIDTKFGMIGSPIIVDYNKVVGIHKLRLKRYNMCKAGRLITTDLIEKLYEWNKQLKGSPFTVHYYIQQDYVPVNNAKQLQKQHIEFKSKIQKSRRESLRTSRSVI